jgi:ParB-like chromosome segregation protein Spo0J
MKYTKHQTLDALLSAIKLLSDLNLQDKIDVINQIRLAIHAHSPFKTEPVDCVQWIKNTEVQANDYNPNTVAPPEMKLLELSIQEDGYTQPIVAWPDADKFTVIDGFHRHRVGKESKPIQKRVNGYLPLVVINQDRSERSDRMASTIRHNRARGKHGVDSMSDIVVELKKRNRSDEWIAKHLGMDSDEVLRLCQVSGLVEMFSNSEFSKSWDIEIVNDNVDFTGLDEETE